MTTEFITSGSSNTLVVSAGVTLEVLAGGSSLSSTILTGAVEDVAGLDSDSLLSSGSQYVLSGGVASATVISGGVQYVSAHGLASGAADYAGGSQIVLAGGTASATVLSGGMDYVSSGGQAFATVISAGAEYVSASGLASATSVYSGGSQYVLAGGTASATVLSGGTQYVSGTGTATATSVGVADPFVSSGASFGSQVVSSGGLASATQVYVSGALYVAGSAVSATLSGGAATVEAGGVAIATTIVAGTADVLTVLSNVYSSVTVGGTLTVLTGGVASDTDIVSGALVDAGGSVTGTVTLGGAGAALVISTAVLPGAVVSGFVAGVAIDFAEVAPASSGSITLDGVDHRIDVVEGGTTFDLLLDPAHDYGTQTLSYAPDGGSGTDVSLACFAEGTRIGTPDGEVAVETLRPGQLVLTLDGSAAPVLWLAVQSVSRRFADPVRTLPIRIRAGALAENVPRRDLLVSPGHALLLDGLLVQANALVNGGSIAPATTMPKMYRYYHVQLPAHAVMFAEGAAAESFVDGPEAFAFDNADGRTAPGDGSALPYPRVAARRQLPEAVRVRLATRAARLSSVPGRSVA